MEGHLVADHLNFCVLARQPVGQHTGGSAEFSSEKAFGFRVFLALDISHPQSEPHIAPIWPPTSE